MNYIVQIAATSTPREFKVYTTIGDKGWSPNLIMVRRESDGALVALREWIGGSGEKPTPPQYVAEDGFTDDIEEAVNFQGDKGDKPNHEWIGYSLRFELPNGDWGTATDLRGEKGEKGEQGEQGFTPYIGNNGNWWVDDQDLGFSPDAYIDISSTSLPTPVTSNNFSLVTEGTYTRSGQSNVVVPEGMMGVLVWNGVVWSLGSTMDLPVSPVDGVVEEGNTQAVSGGEVYDYVKDELALKADQADLAQLESDVSGEFANLRSELYEWIGVDAEVLSYATSLITPISINQVKRIDTLTKGLKTRLEVSNLSDIFDVLYIHANETQESALRNLAKNAHHATTSAITFEPYKGLKGNKTSHFVDTNYNPSTATNYKQDSACMGGYVSKAPTNIVGGRPVLYGVDNNTINIRLQPASSLFIHFPINSGRSNPSLPNSLTSPERAFFIQNRMGESTSEIYKNGKIYYQESLTSNGVPNGNVYLFARNEIGTGAVEFSDARLSCWFAGKGLTEAQITIINDEIEKYMVSISNNFMVNITTPTVIFTFDDGNAEHATLTKSVFDAYGKKCTHFIISDRIGQEGFMTVANLQTLNTAGYDLQCHSKDHSNLTTLNEAQLIEQFEAVDTFFSTAGLPVPKHHAYPGGARNPLTLNVVYKYRQSARRIGDVDTYYSGYIMPEYNIVTARAIDGYTEASNMNTAIDIAKANNGVVIFYGHGVYENDPSESAYPNPVKAQALRDAIAYAIAQGVEVKTYSEVFDRATW